MAAVASLVSQIAAASAFINSQAVIMSAATLSEAMDSYVTSLCTQIRNVDSLNLTQATSISTAVVASVFTAPQKARLAEAINAQASSS